jgi:hypothetical protein
MGTGRLEGNGGCFAGGGLAVKGSESYYLVVCEWLPFVADPGDCV